jgi:cytochrome c553
MKKLALVFAVVIALMVTVSVAVAAADAYPNGCADCHKKDGAKDTTLSATVKGLGKHPPVSPTADINSCVKCHKAGTKMALNTKMHDSHQKA